MQFRGLTEQEVRESRARYGRNTFADNGHISFFEMLRENFADPIIRILLVALTVNLVFCLFGQSEWYESLGIAIAVLLAALISAFSEYKNDTAFQKLQEEASRIQSRVYRDGRVTEIPVDDLVYGDEVLLQTGDRIPADGYLLYGEADADQSQLNGESEEVRKTALPAHDGAPEEPATGRDLFSPHLVFRGSTITSGEAVMKITAVGERTVYGTIAAGLRSGIERDTPLKVKLRRLAGYISIFGYAGGILVMLAYLLHAGLNAGIPMEEYFELPWSDFVREHTGIANFWSDALHGLMFAVVIIVMAVPEGLPLMIAIVTALNMGKMLKRQVLTRKVSGIETAGSLNILFSDKTGTITCGKPEVIGFWNGQCQSFRKLSDMTAGYQKAVREGLELNNQAVLTGNTASGFRAAGSNATDRTLLEAAAALREPPLSGSTKTRIPFSSSVKYSGAVLTDGRCLLKGAPEILLPRCRLALDNAGNRIPCAPGPIQKLLNDLAAKAVRVLLLAETLAASPDGRTAPEGDLILIAVVGIRDEVRPEARTAISEVREAGISVVMITGDRRETAMAIAGEAGLLQQGEDLVLSSDELASLSDDAIRECLPRLRVISRALPEDKSRLVEIAKSLDLVTGMTGDGVNDSPALKKADVGFAMGSGTEVAKEASEIVILDDNFASIREAVLYGRTIFSSIRKFIVFQLTVNAAAVFISVVMPLMGRAVPLNIVQILWINLIMDTLAALALGGEPALPRYLKAAPRKRQGQLINRYMLASVGTSAVWICLIGLLLLNSAGFQALLGFDPENSALTGTAFFTFFIFSTVFNALNARTDSMNLLDHITENRLFFAVMSVIAATQILMTESGTYSEMLGRIMNCQGLTLQEWTVTLLLAATVIPADLAKKYLLKRCGVNSEE